MDARLDRLDAALGEINQKLDRLLRHNRRKDAGHIVCVTEDRHLQFNTHARPSPNRLCLHLRADDLKRAETFVEGTCVEAADLRLTLEDARLMGATHAHLTKLCDGGIVYLWLYHVHDHGDEPKAVASD